MRRDYFVGAIRLGFGETFDLFFESIDLFFHVHDFVGCGFPSSSQIFSSQINFAFYSWYIPKGEMEFAGQGENIIILNIFCH